MKPIQLVMTAFGPYSKKECIDFREIKDQGIFLVTGPTGAGKTTIFDAIIFALYGESSGALRDAESFRSDHADEELLTSVTLDFELKGKVYTVHRIPRQMKPKANKDGYTLKTAEAEFTGDNEAVSGVKEVTEKIKDLFGLNAEQFRQIMMIPQGEFRRLILSDSKEKAEIFRKLFGTAVFEKIQDSLKLEEDLIKNKHFEVITGLLATCGRFEVASDETLNSNLEAIKQNPVYPSFDTLAENMSLFNVKEQTKINDLENQWNKESDTLDQKKTALMLGTQINERFTVLEKTQQSLNQHLDKHKDHAAIIEEIRWAKTADQLLGDEKFILESQKSVKERKSALDITLLSIEKNSKVLKRALVDFERIEEEEKVLKAVDQQIIELNYIKEDVKTLKLHQDQLAQTETTWMKQRDQLEKEKQAFEKGQLKQNELQEEIEKSLSDQIEALAVGKALNGIKNTCDLATNAKNKQLEMQQSKENCSQIKQNLENLRVDYQQVEKEWQTLDHAFIKGYAGILAESLITGEPCQVCGSKAHPAPAHSEKLISKSELDDKRQDLETVKISVEKQIVSLEAEMKNQLKLEDEVNRLTITLRSMITPDSVISPESMLPFESVQIEEMILALDQAQKQMQERLNQLSDKASRDETLKKRLELLKQEQKNREIEKNRLSDEVSKLKSTLEVLKSKIEGIKAKLPSALYDYEDLIQTLKKLEQQKNSLMVFIQSATKTYNQSVEEGNRLSDRHELEAKEYEKSKKAFEDARTVIGERFRKEGFLGFEDYQSKKRTPENLSQLERTRDDYKTKMETLKAQVAALNHELKDKKRSDEGALKAEIQILQEHLRKNQIHIETLRSSYKMNGLLLNEVIKGMAALKDLETQMGYVGNLAKIARGQNDQRLSFENFVLSQYFEDVLYAANLRLSHMTSGRFELIRKKDRTKGNAQSGLDIEVLDQFTGKMRLVKTLSGGETFKASLALALGLSDVVQSSSGGINLETMFIDEGFGTLDSDSLDKAIGSLLALGGKNRLVGIISHVAELKERIPVQLTVIPSMEGATTQLVFR